MHRAGMQGSPYRKLYDWRWRKERVSHLAHNPLCVMCLAEGRIEAATVVDHITPHKGNMRLFLDKANRQSLCKPHHDKDKQALERMIAAAVPHDVDGYRDGW